MSYFRRYSVDSSNSSNSSSFNSYFKKEMIDTFSCNADAINYNKHLGNQSFRTEEGDSKMFPIRKSSLQESEPNRPYGETYFGHI